MTVKLHLIQARLATSLHSSLIYLSEMNLCTSISNLQSALMESTILASVTSWIMQAQQGLYLTCMKSTVHRLYLKVNVRECVLMCMHKISTCLPRKRLGCFWELSPTRQSRKRRSRVPVKARDLLSASGGTADVL